MNASTMRKLLRTIPGGLLSGGFVIGVEKWVSYPAGTFGFIIRRGLLSGGGG